MTLGGRLLLNKMDFILKFVNLHKGIQDFEVQDWASLIRFGNWEHNVVQTPKPLQLGQPNNHSPKEQVLYRPVQSLQTCRPVPQI